MKNPLAAFIILLAAAAVAGGLWLYFDSDAPSNSVSPSPSAATINIYCNSDFCAEQQIWLGAGTLARDCFRDAADCAATWPLRQNAAAGYAIRYPDSFGATVWRAYAWPPKITAVPPGQNPVSAGCPDLEKNQMTEDREETFNNLPFHFYGSASAGAGSLYSTYCYIAQKDQRYYALEFIIQSHTGCVNGDCGAYCGTANEQACRQFDLTRDVTGPIKQMVATFNVTK